MGGSDQDSFVVAVELVGAEVHVVGDRDQAWVWTEPQAGAGGAVATAGCDLAAGLWGSGSAEWAGKWVGTSAGTGRGRQSPLAANRRLAWPRYVLILQI